VEEALIEMYLAGVSVRRVEDITQALWGTRVSASTVSDPCAYPPKNKQDDRNKAKHQGCNMREFHAEKYMRGGWVCGRIRSK
jgi:hypothetical protein